MVGTLEAGVIARGQDPARTYIYLTDSLALLFLELITLRLCRIFF
jgi:hypothetical protein